MKNLNQILKFLKKVIKTLNIYFLGIEKYWINNFNKLFILKCKLEFFEINLSHNLFLFIFFKKFTITLIFY